MAGERGSGGIFDEEGYESLIIPDSAFACGANSFESDVKRRSFIIGTNAPWKT